MALNAKTINNLTNTKEVERETERGEISYSMVINLEVVFQSILSKNQSIIGNRFQFHSNMTTGRI